MKLLICVFFICGMIQGYVYNQAYKYERLSVSMEKIIKLHSAGYLSSAAYMELTPKELMELGV